MIKRSIAPGLPLMAGVLHACAGRALARSRVNPAGMLRRVGFAAGLASVGWLLGAPAAPARPPRREAGGHVVDGLVERRIERACWPSPPARQAHEPP
jgi:hypothetical protein